MEKEIFKCIRYGIWILCGSGVVFEITPFIKANPISAILNWIGKKLNKDVESKITVLETKVDKVQTDLQSHKVESQRRDILDFADALMHGEQMSKENYDNIISLHDKYNKYIIDNKLENGQIDLAFSYISNKYQECMKNNGFYIGK